MDWFSYTIGCPMGIRHMKKKVPNVAQEPDGSKRSSTQSTSLNRKSWRAMKSAEDRWEFFERGRWAPSGRVHG